MIITIKSDSWFPKGQVSQVKSNKSSELKLIVVIVTVT